MSNCSKMPMGSIQGNQINAQNNIFGDEIEELNEQLDEE